MTSTSLGRARVRPPRGSGDAPTPDVSAAPSGVRPDDPAGTRSDSSATAHPVGPEAGSTVAGSTVALAPVGTGGGTLMEILGGRRSAFDAALPTAVFVACLLVLGRTAPSARVSGSVVGGVLAGAAVAGWRWARERRPRAAVLGLVPVLAGAALVARTGRAEDFFLVRIAANALSAIAWAASVWIGRPLLGVVVGVVLRQRGAWRRDPDLLAGYSRASWWWAGSFALRTGVFTGFWAAGQAVVLGVAQVALSWPLTTAVLLLSWRTLRRALPDGHPGLRHPRPGPVGAATTVMTGTASTVIASTGEAEAAEPA